MSIVGVLPAAGQATRLNGLPKFLLPIPEGNLLDWHCKQMRAASAERVLVGTSWVNSALVAQHAPNGTEQYLVSTKTMTETVLAARRNAGDADVLFGMPDTYWANEDVYEQISTAVSDADVTLACWFIRDDQRGKLGQCELDLYGNVLAVVDKSPDCSMPWVWGAMYWKPSFWNCLTPTMPHVGYGLPVAMDRGLNVKAVMFMGDYHDCGTFESYARLCSTFVKDEVYDR